MEHGFSHAAGERVGHGGQFFRNNLAVEIDIGAPVEFYPHNGEAVGG